MYFKKEGWKGGTYLVLEKQASRTQRAALPSLGQGEKE